MFLFRYWSFWNFNWYLCSELGLLPLNGPLKISIINTSILGALMTYIYPKKIILNIKEKNIIIKNNKLKFLDFIFHQIPLIRLNCSSQILRSNICGLYCSIPLSLWIFYLNLLKIEKNKIYKIKFNYLLFASTSISCLIGILHHRPLLYKSFIS